MVSMAVNRDAALDSASCLTKPLDLSEGRWCGWAIVVDGVPPAPGGAATRYGRLDSRTKGRIG